MLSMDIGFIFAGISISLQGVFQALDCGISSLVISICRQFLFILPAAWMFTLFIDTDLTNAWIVWLTFPIAETVTAVIAVLLMLYAYRRKVRMLQS